MALDFTIPKDLNDTASKVDGLNQLANKYLVAPFAGFGIAGFKFSAFKEYKGELKSRITDIYNEKNVALQDNIALEPELFSLSGLVGELTYEYKDNKPSGVRKLAEKLTTIAGYLPLVSSTLKTLQNSINTKVEPSQAFADATLGSALNLYQTYQKLNPPKTVQAKAYNYFLALRNAKVLISFETPYGFKSNFAILNIVMTQPEYTETTSDVALILKEIRYAQSSTVKFDPKKYSGRGQQQNEPVADKGVTQGKATDKKDFLNIISNAFKNLGK
jgi:hypothetical protein